MQGAFSPKNVVKPNAEPSRSSRKLTKEDDVEEFCWTVSSLGSALLERLNSHASSLGISETPFQDVKVLDPLPPFSKVRLECESSAVANHVISILRQRRVSPHCLFFKDSPLGVSFGSRPFQWTQLTTTELPPLDQAWSRSNPPKFRRLLAKPGEDPDTVAVERLHTRFVFVANILPSSAPEFWWDLHVVAAAIRRVVESYDTTGLGVEIFVSHHKVQHCHVGMRTPQDAQALLASLQDKQIELQHRDEMQQLQVTTSGQLFLDYAAIAHRSLDLAQARAEGREPARGDPDRSECTSQSAHVQVPGLVIIPDFCSCHEEETLLAVLLGPHAPWAPGQATPTQGRVVRRKVQHYGYVFDYQSADVLRDRSQSGGDCPALPTLAPEASDDLESFLAQCASEGNGWDLLAGVIERVRRFDFGVPHRTFPTLNQLTVNHYKPGEGIGAHVDTPSAFGDGLISISLGSGVVMEFRKVNTAAGGNTKKLVYLPPRSLVLMSGPARYEWEHLIVTRSTDTVEGEVLPRQLRVSLTLRTALDLSGQPLPLVSSRRFPPKWGSPDELLSPLVTPSCELEHVQNVYDAIAVQWHHTRGRRGVLWPGATQFLQRLPRGSLVADVGCGDGKYFPAIWEAGSYVIGTDISLPLLKTSVASPNDEQIPESRRVGDELQHLWERPAVAVADCMSLPIRTDSCDAAICIAVLHHLSTPCRRKRCIEELARIVKPGGTINIQAWALEQIEGSRHRFASNDVLVPFNAQPKYLTLEVHNSQDGDSLPDQSNGVSEKASIKSTAQRYSEAFSAEYDDQKGLVVFQRYCHLYKQGEMEALCHEVSNVTLVESGFEKGNYFVILEVTGAKQK